MLPNSTLCARAEGVPVNNVTNLLKYRNVTNITNIRNIPVNRLTNKLKENKFYNNIYQKLTTSLHYLLLFTKQTKSRQLWYSAVVYHMKNSSKFLIQFSEKKCQKFELFCMDNTIGVWANFTQNVTRFVLFHKYTKLHGPDYLPVWLSTEALTHKLDTPQLWNLTPNSAIFVIPQKNAQLNKMGFYVDHPVILLVRFT